METTENRETAELISKLPASGKQALSLFASGFLAASAVLKESKEKETEDGCH